MTVNVLTVIPKLDYAYHHATDENAKAIEQVFITHLVADAFQPTHTYAKYDKDCRDLNYFCLVPRKTGACAMSIHSYWDKAAGALDPTQMDIRETATQLQKQYPIAFFKQDLKNLKENVKAWQARSKIYADFVYSIRPQDLISKKMSEQAQTIAMQQMTLAGYVLAEMIK